MEENSEENKENYSLLDQKRKDEIILELKKEINEQIKKNSKSKEENINNIDNSEVKELFEKNNNNNKDLKSTTSNNNIDLNEKNFIFQSNITFKEINNFIKKNEIHINNENNNKEENKGNEELIFPKNDMNDLILNNAKKVENEKKINLNFEKQTSNIYLNKIKNKKEILFNQNQNKKKLISNNSFNIAKKIVNKNNNQNKIYKNIKPLSKAKSTEKIKFNKNKNNIKKKNAKTNRHQIIPNAKSNEKFKNIKIEINNKFKEEHPFKPKINSNKNRTKNKLFKETKEEKYIRLSRPKIFEIKGIHMIKTEESKLQTEDNLIKKNKQIKKINPKEVSNRLYKLHQQIKEKKEQVKKIFEKKELDKCSFNPEINSFSKKIMNKTGNNLSFNERNDNYIKYKKESILKLREEIDKKIESKNQTKINTNNKNNDDVKVYDRLYENNYYSNMININLDKNDFNNEITQKNNNKEIKSFLERQKVYENIKQEHLNKYKFEYNINQNNAENDELTFKPRINSTSDLIARTNPERVGGVFEDKYQRLYNEAEILKNKREQLIEFYNAQYNFTPTINEISKLIGNNHSYLDKNESYYINNNTLESNGCTFKPNLINNEKYNSIKSNYKYDENISQKIEEEILNRNNKINRLKSEYTYNSQKECVFVPETNKNIYNLKKYYTNNDVYYQKSLKKHLDQMEKAKKAKKEKEDLEKNAFITGENYSNEKISFKPFNLSKTNKRKNIEKIKEEMKSEEMKECSFHPVTNETIHKNIVKKLLNEKK